MQDDFEKGEFEKDWQNAFENAEIKPWRTSWDSVKMELDAVNAENKRKRFFMFLRYSAAACFLLAIGLFTAFWFNGSENKVLSVLTDKKENNQYKNPNLTDSKILSDQKTKNRKNLNESDIEKSKSQKNKNTNNYKKDKFLQVEKQNQLNSSKSEKERSISSVNLITINKKRNFNKSAKEILIQGNDYKILPNEINSDGRIGNILAIYTLKKTTKDFNNQLIVLPKKENYLPLIGDDPEKKEEKKAIQRWNMDLAYAPGSFQPNIQSYKASSYASSVQSNQVGSTNSLNINYYSAVSKTAFQNASNSVDNDLSHSKPAFSYQVNLGAGYSLNSKFSVNMGLQYLYQNSQVTTSQYFTDNLSNNKNVYLTDVVSTDAKASQLETLDKFSITNSFSRTNTNSDITINNTYRYLSVPIIIRYKLINKKIGLSAGTGISADIFINNQIGNHKDGVNEQTFNSSNSIYKSLAYSGLLNVRMDYKFSKRYSFFLEPGFRTALNSFTRSSSVNSYPISLNVGTGFRFQF